MVAQLSDGSTIECLEEFRLEGMDVGEFWEGLRMEADLGVGFLLFRGTWRLGLLSSRSGLGPCRDYSVHKCFPVFPYLTYSQCEGSAV